MAPCYLRYIKLSKGAPLPSQVCTKMKKYVSIWCWVGVVGDWHNGGLHFPSSLGRLLLNFCICCHRPKALWPAQQDGC